MNYITISTVINYYILRRLWISITLNKWNSSRFLYRSACFICCKQTCSMSFTPRRRRWWWWWRCCWWW